MKVIAEAGCNHSNLCEAIEMINRSKEIGCWATKFQIYNDDLIKDSEDYEFLKSIMLDSLAVRVLFEHGKSIGQEVFFTCMFPEAVDWCELIGVNYYKIRFADNNNRELYQKIKKTKKFTFVSIDDILTSIWKSYIDYGKGAFLYCVPKYPAKINDYKPYLYAPDGFSDHTKDIKMLEEVKDFGYDYFEKHVKLNDDCIESAWSCTFEELEEVLKHE